MQLRSKLTIGLGFLFLIIFAIAAYSSLQIQRLATDARNILQDNYNSLVYCKNMFLAVDDMNASVTNRTFGIGSKQPTAYYSSLFDAGRAAMESNLAAEKNNITEIDENEYVQELTSGYGTFLKLSIEMMRKVSSPAAYYNDFIPTYSNVRQLIVRINDLNMQAVERKSKSATDHARTMIVSIAAFGTLCVVLAFFYFWYFPFYVSNSIAYVAEKMRKLLAIVGIKAESKTTDETVVMLQSIILLENKLAEAKATKSKR